MRDLLLTMTIMMLLPVAAYRPWIGILVWSWLGYMNPHRLTWSFAYFFPFAQLVAIAVLLGVILKVVHEGLRPRAFVSGELKLLLFLWIVFTVTTITALHPADAWPAWGKISKILLMTFLTVYLIDDEKKLRYLVLVIALSIGYYGFKGGVFAILTAGQSRIWGPPGSFIEDNNSLALALNMTIPLLYYLAEIEPRKWLRNFFMLTTLLCVLSVVFTYSRGGFLGLIVVLASITLAARMSRKLLIIGLGLIALPLAIASIPQAWQDRISTIGTYQEDGSALSRLEAWKAARNLAFDRPFFGGGFEVLNDYDTYLL